jgi:hypothetical protein
MHAKTGMPKYDIDLVCNPPPPLYHMVHGIYCLVLAVQIQSFNYGSIYKRNVETYLN